MTLYASKYKSIGEIQSEFNDSYPFLKIEFDQKKNGNSSTKHPATADDVIEITDATTVVELQKTLWKLFGLATQVFRRSGNIWLETTMTNHWTLQQQNQHGEEISAWIR